jgi:hypothetical protein
MHLNFLFPLYYEFVQLQGAAVKLGTISAGCICETRDHIKVSFDLSYDEGAALCSCSANLDSWVTDKSADKERSFCITIIMARPSKCTNLEQSALLGDKIGGYSSH